MVDLPDLPPSVGIALQVAIVVVTALVGYFVLRGSVRIAEEHIVERRRAESAGVLLPADELERRVATIARLVERIAGVVIAIIATLMILDLFGIDIAPAIAGLGVAGIAVGLGAQTLIRDWLSGVFIVLENQYNAGDVVRIAGVEGTVEDFGLRRTTLRDVDGTIHIVPNGQITVATNLTRLWTPIRLEIDVATDADRARSIIDRTGEELLAEEAWAKRLLEPPHVVSVVAGADSSVVTVRAAVRAAERRSVTGELRTRLLADLDAADVRPAGTSPQDG